MTHWTYENAEQNNHGESVDTKPAYTKLELKNIFINTFLAVII